MVGSVHTLNSELKNDPEYSASLNGLQTASEAFGEHQATGVFIPHFPESWFERSSSLKKIIWCGSATRKWGECGALDHCRTPEFYDDDPNDKDRHAISKSIFWRTMRSVGCHLEKSVTSFDPELKYSKHNQPETVVWSNVFRVGGPNGEPSRRLQQAQIQDCIACLKREIHLAKPNAVIFHTGYLSTNFTQAYFGAQDVGEDIPGCDGRVGVYAQAKTTVPHIWMTRHTKHTDQIRISDALAALNYAGVFK